MKPRVWRTNSSPIDGLPWVTKYAVRAGGASVLYHRSWEEAIRWLTTVWCIVDWRKQ